MTAVAAAGRGAAPAPLLLTASIGCALTVLDSNVIGLVLPIVARDFGATFAQSAWVVSAYMLCFSALLLPAGAIADRFGRRRMFLAGLAAFGCASLLCGLAPSIAWLHGARALLGAASAFVLAPALALIGHGFPDEAERNRAWAIWGGIMGLTMMLAPLLGGVIAARLGWRAAFFVNAPICAALAAAALLRVEESRREPARRLDPGGILLFATLMFGLTWGLIRGQAQGWTSAEALAGFGLGAGALAVFLAVERRAAEPMLDLGLFRAPRMIGAVWAMFAYAACAQVMASLLPLLLQNGAGLAPVQAGAMMLPFGVAMFAFPHVGRLLGRRLASARILPLGLGVVGLGNALAGWGAGMDATPLLLAGMAVLGAGGGLLNGETQKAIMSVIPRDRAGMGSGLGATARFSGVLLGFTLLGGVMAAATRARLAGASCPEGAPCPAGFIDAVVAGDLPKAVAGLEGPGREAAAALARAAYLGGFSTALHGAALLACASAVAVWALMRAR